MGAFSIGEIEMLDCYNPDLESDDGNYPWITLSRHMPQLCYIATRVFKWFGV